MSKNENEINSRAERRGAIKSVLVERERGSDLNPDNDALEGINEGHSKARDARVCVPRVIDILRAI